MAIIVSCGTLRADIERLISSGELPVDTVLFTDICLKERPRELERQLREKLQEAKQQDEAIVVVYGTGCFLDATNPSRTIDSILEEAGSEIRRVKEHICIDMLLSKDEQAALEGGLKAYWLMPAWIDNRDDVFFEWDIGKRNQTFPQNDIALMLDTQGRFAEMMDAEPEKILEFSDWMGLALDARDADLERFQALLTALLDTSARE